MKIKANIATGGSPQTLNLKGRIAWTMLELIKAGDKGISSLHNPAPRLSHYVLCLRRKGIAIETVMQAHGGPFPGEHGIYHLRSAVTIDQVEGRV